MLFLPTKFREREVNPVSPLLLLVLSD